MTKHYHYGNGSAGCLFDTQEVCETRGAAISMAETIFDGSLCAHHMHDMSKSLRSHAAKNGATYYFDRDCEDCNAGADLVSITPCDSRLLRNKYDEVECMGSDHALSSLKAIQKDDHYQEYMEALGQNHP